MLTVVVPTLTPGRAFAVTVFAFAITMMGTTLPTPMYTIYQQRLGFSLSMSTVIFAAYALGVLLALLIFGRWSDVVGRRPMLLGGLAVALASDVVFLTTDTDGQLIKGRVLSGISAGIFVGTATASVIENAPPAWRARAPYVATAANIGGLGLGPLVAGILVEYASWPLHLAFWVHVVLTVVAAGLLWLVAETVERVPGRRPGFQRLAVPAAARRTFIGACVGGFAGFAVLGLFVAVSPRFVGQVLGISNSAVSGLTVSLVFAASIVAQIGLKALPTERAVNIGCSALIVGSLLIALSLAVESFALLIVAAVVVGAGQGMSFSKGLASILAKIDTHQRAEVTSTFFVILYIAISLPVIGEGIAAQHWGLADAGIAFSLSIAALAVVALAIIVSDQRRPQATS
ncbi:MAG: transporter [Nocardioidaceae bacterium]|nr:transporter [Nocardioidaceae bacterium]